MVAHKEFEEERAGKESGWEVRQILSHLYSQPLELGLLERGDGQHNKGSENDTMQR